MSFLFFDFAYMYSFHIIYSYLSPCRSFSCPFDVPLMPCLLHQAFLYCQSPALQCLNIFWTLYWRSQLTSKLFPDRVLAACPVCTWGLSNQKWMADMQILMQSERGCKTLYHDTFITFTMVIVAVVVIKMSYSSVQLRSLKSCWSPGFTLKKTYLCYSAPASAKSRVTQATVLWCTQTQSLQTCCIWFSQCFSHKCIHHHKTWAADTSDYYGHIPTYGVIQLYRL